MKILGVDPGLERTGWGIIETKDRRLLEAGLITTAPEFSFQRRLFIISRDFEFVLHRYPIQWVYVEKLYFSSKTAKNMADVLQARGVILSVVGKYEIPLKEIPPTQIKKSITNNGRAKKEDVIRTLKKLYGIEDPSFTDDVYDAIAVALSFT
ncbi:MAG: crossover junction endodeoxyribonuclease RuvC, partial [Leptospiraceae bacterium]|nr:crossover junction endodeoxyribonuclease RuvC [Leptospiraceae bacterium]MDW7977030.1 crossover junction endodeoxyribonuclease RuvC [Leptospiraceae bacterium]